MRHCKLFAVLSVLLFAGAIAAAAQSPAFDKALAGASPPIAGAGVVRMTSDGRLDLKIQREGRFSRQDRDPWDWTNAIPPQ